MSENKSFVQRAIDDMKEGASEQHRIDRENYAAIKADSKARFEEAKKPTPDFEEFAQAKDRHSPFYPDACRDCNHSNRTHLGNNV